MPKNSNMCLRYLAKVIVTETGEVLNEHPFIVLNDALHWSRLHKQEAPDHTIYVLDLLEKMGTGQSHKIVGEF